MDIIAARRNFNEALAKSLTVSESNREEEFHKENKSVKVLEDKLAVLRSARYLARNSR